MRFMMLVKSSAKAESGALPDAAVLAEMGKYNQALANAGALLAADGLHASAKGARVRLSGEKVTVVDGPFAEANELVAGYWVIQARSREEAVAWAKRVPFEDGEIEIRPLYELSDFPADPAETPGGWRDQERAFRDAADAAAAAPAPPARKPGTTPFIVMLKANDKTESGAPPEPEVLAAMGALMQELVVSGALLSGEGLKPSSMGARVRFSGDKRTVIDGPFTESKELIAGYTVIQVASREEAIAFARRWIQIHADGLHVGEGEIEIRQLLQ
jgi:hypothetical protein